MSRVKAYQFDVIVIGLILVFSLIVWWPTRVLPYHWDSAGFVINSARKLLASNFSPLIVPDSDFAHPPLFIATLAMVWKLFGQNLISSHLLMLPSLPIYLISVYYLAKRLFNREVAVGTALLCATTPVVLAEYGLIYIDLPMAALNVLGLAFWTHKKYVIGTVIFTLAALIKLPVLGIVVGLFLWHTIKKEYKLLIFLVAPFVFVGLWLVYHHNIEGWWIAIPNRLSQSPNTIETLIASLIFFTSKFFLDHGRIYLTISGLAGIGYLIFKGRQKVANMYILFVLLVCGSILFVLSGEFGARYGIFLYPLWYSICVYAIFTVCKILHIQRFFIVIIGILVVVYITNWHPKTPASRSYEFRPSENFAYRDMIEIGMQMSTFAQKQFPKAVYYGGFPEVYQLTQPYQGYVRSPLTFYQCQNFSLDPALQQIIIFHPYSPSQLACNSWLARLFVIPLARFEQNGKWTELLLVNATESAKINTTLPPKL